MPKSEKQIHLRVKGDVREELLKLAQEYDNSISWVVKRIIVLFLEHPTKLLTTFAAFLIAITD